MLEFRSKVLFMGFGAVAHCALPILVKHIRVPPGNITIMDFDDAAEAAAQEWVARGCKFVKDRVTFGENGSVSGNTTLYNT